MSKRSHAHEWLSFQFGEKIGCNIHTKTTAAAGRAQTATWGSSEKGQLRPRARALV